MLRIFRVYGLVPSLRSGGKRGDPTMRLAVLHRVPERDPVLLPAPVDQGLDFGSHLNLRRPFPGALPWALVSGVDADLPAVALARRGVVEMVERPLREHDVA